MLLARLDQVLRQAVHGSLLSTEQERALRQAPLEMLLQFAHKPCRAVGLTGAVLPDFLIRIDPVEFDNATRAIDFGHEVVGICGVAPQEIDVPVGRPRSGLVQEARSGGLVVRWIDELHDGLDGLAFTGQAHCVHARPGLQA